MDGGIIDFIFLLNQDAWFKKIAIEYIVKVAQLNGLYGNISPFHIRGDTTTLEYKFIECIQLNVCPRLV